MRTLDTVAEMVGMAVVRDGTQFTVRGYHRPGDDGGGVFRYEAASELEVDGGTVLKPKQGKGRFLRVVDEAADVHAEWFGAYADGDSPNAHDDHAAINACLTAFGRVKLLAKTYGVRGKPTHYNPEATYNAIDLGPGFRIEGAGREQTKIKLLSGTDPKGSAPGDNYFNVLGNRGFHESAENVVIRDLTIDCNFDGQNKQTTINAIGLRGGGALVERVNFRGYGTGRHPTGSSRECFVVHQGLVYKDGSSSRKAATLRDLDFTAPGHNGDLAGNVGEITHIALGGAHNFDNYSWILPKGKDPAYDPANNGENENNWWPSYGGLVENCTFHDETYDPDGDQKSPLHAITYGDCIGMVVRNNRTVNFEGVGVFVMSWWNRDTTVTGNHFEGVTCGVALHIKGTEGKPLQSPRHENVFVNDNTIVLCQPENHPYPPIGIHLYGQALGQGIRMRNLLFRNNRIRGRAFINRDGQRRYPVGIGVQILHANYANLVFENNTLDIPDFGDGVWIPQEPGSMSMTFFPLARWADDAKSGNVVYRGNHTSDGKPLRPILADWYYKNKPTWGESPAP